MAGGIRMRRLLWPLLAVIVVALVGYQVVRRRAAPQQAGSASPEFAELTEGGPEVDAFRRASENANVVVCVLDAARPDHIGYYGYPRETTPNIDRIAGQSLVFDNHFSQYPQTTESTTSLFTSQYPDTHLATTARALPESRLTIARGLKPAGYYTAIFTMHIAVSAATGIGVDFDHSVLIGGRDWSDRLGVPEGDRTAEGLIEAVTEWLESNPQTPFFMYIHFTPPHYPYNAPDELTQLFAGQTPPTLWQGSSDLPGANAAVSPMDPMPMPDQVNLYDANLRHADWAVGQLEAALADTGLLDNTIFIVTADHGEPFGEHEYRWHSNCPYDEAIHIPLIMKFPGDTIPPGRIGALTQSIDLLPTIFDVLNVSYRAEGVQGQSLLPVLAGQVDEVNDYVISHTARSQERGQGLLSLTNPSWYVIRDHHWSLILEEGGEPVALYDLEADPRQTRNVLNEEPERAAEMKEAFVAFASAQTRRPLRVGGAIISREPPPQGRQIELSDDVRRELRSLGYVE